MRQRRWLVWLAAGLLAALTARLGLWQLDRAAHKQALQRELDVRGGLPALQAADLARDEATALAQHQRTVRLQGRWRASATVALDNRQMGGKPGSFVLTPLVLADGTAVVVQRGWLPRNFQDRTQLALPPLPEAEVWVEGRIAPPPARLYEFAPSGSGVLRQNLDIAAFAREIGLALRPLSVQQLPSAGMSEDGLKRDWPAPALDVHKHHGYAFQWFSLSLLTVLLVVWFQLIAPRRRARQQRPS